MVKKKKHHMAAVKEEESFQQQEAAYKNVFENNVQHQQPKENVNVNEKESVFTINVNVGDSSISNAADDFDASALLLYVSCSSEAGVMTDVEVEGFLSSRNKRGRGTVGPRMNMEMEGCFTSSGKCYFDKYSNMVDDDDDEAEDVVGSRVKNHRGSALSRPGIKDSSIMSSSYPEAKPKRGSASSRLGNNHSMSPFCLDTMRRSVFSRLGNNDPNSVTHLRPEADRKSAFSRLGYKDPCMSLACPEPNRMQILGNVVNAWRLGVISSAAGHPLGSQSIWIDPKSDSNPI